MSCPRFQIYKAKDGWRWRLLAANGRTLASGEAFTRKADAERAVETMVQAVAQVVVAQQG